MNCFHGGAFWRAIGPDFSRLGRSREVIAADVLDAWFPPAPAVIEALAGAPVDWWSRTSPPTHAEGVADAIAAQTGIDANRILIGAGSSALMFLALGKWLGPGSKVLLVDPTYGEYRHLAELAGAEITTLSLEPPRFRFDLDRWVEEMRRERYDLAVLVNPNNPTGGAIPAVELRAALERVPPETRVWIDEAYACYAPECRWLGEQPNVFVVRSHSKSWALSGLRSAALYGDASEIARLRRWTPPWSVSLPAQIATIAALRAETYYEARYEETRALRRRFARELEQMGLSCLEGAGNWVLVRLPEGRQSDEVVGCLAHRGIYVRDAGRTSEVLRDRYVRIAIRPEIEQTAILEGLRWTLV
jgi:histidinol-phosphate/aromatic aminotransferase/cobyric acid decarboxylase-like protein